MDIRKRIENEIVYIDGGLGSSLIKMGLPTGMMPEVWNITNPSDIVALHREYIRAGAQVITTNTFGANELKIGQCEYTLTELVSAAVKNAQTACEKKQSSGRGCVYCAERRTMLKAFKATWRA